MTNVQRRTIVVTLRLTYTEYNRLFNLAIGADVDLSKYIRYILFGTPGTDARADRKKKDYSDLDSNQ